MPDVKPGVTVITCTGDRPEAFMLCREFLGRQTYRGKLQWIVVNDGAYAVAHTHYPKWPADRGIETRLFPEPKWKPGQNTLARNLLAAIPEVLFDKVLFMEDDDAYSSDYVEKMVAALDDRSEGQISILGDPLSRYYHVPSRRFRLMENQAMASLAQTAIRSEALPVLAQVCEQGAQFIDCRLWAVRRDARRRLLQRIGGVVSMKGLPGRPGIGIGHQPDRNPELWTPDPDLSTLRSWIGDDVELYRSFMK